MQSKARNELKVVLSYRKAVIAAAGPWAIVSAVVIAAAVLSTAVLLAPRF